MRCSKLTPRRSLYERVSDHTRLDRSSTELRLLNPTVMATLKQAFHLTSHLLETASNLQCNLAMKDRPILTLTEAAQALLKMRKRSASEGSGHVVYVR